ncbi:MAG TPA: hypothetical protein V6C65_04905, partial [Allocoleopsis sp.]
MQLVQPPSFQTLPLSAQLEAIALLLGGILLLISLLDDGVRSISFGLATLTLAGVIWKRPQVPVALIYLLHGVAVIALVSSIDWIYPTLNNGAWAKILLGLMAIEWSLSSGRSYPHWRRSAWSIGLVLAGISYGILLPPLLGGGDRNLIWLVTPILLTGLSRLPQFGMPRLAAQLSTGALLANLLLLSSLHTWIISLGVATVLMLLNTLLLPGLGTAAMTIGFGLGFEASVIRQVWGDQLLGDDIALILAINLWVLWLLRDLLARRSAPLKQFYANAANGWAIALCVLALLLLTGLSVFAYSYQEKSWQLLLGAGLVIGAIAYRIRQQPTNLGFWGLAWGVETAVIILLTRWEGDLTTLAQVNLGLGLASQIAGDLWVVRSQQPYRSS